MSVVVVLETISQVLILGKHKKKVEFVRLTRQDLQENGPCSITSRIIVSGKYGFGGDTAS